MTKDGKSGYSVLERLRWVSERGDGDGRLRIRVDGGDRQRGI